MATIRIAEDYALAGLGGAPFFYDESLASSIAEIEGRVEEMRRAGRLSACSLRQRQSAKGTWFFRLDFGREDRAARYLHTFRWAHPDLSDDAKVSIRSGREEAAYDYQWLDQIT